MSKLKTVVAKSPEELADALGLARWEVREWQVQFDLTKRLKEIVKKRNLTHAQVAEMAGTSRTRITAILNDNLTNVSSDLLIRILDSLGYRVKISLVKIDSAA